MDRFIRPLALANVAVAVAFALPLLVWIAADQLSRGTLEVKFPAAESSDRTLAQIQSTQDIESLRRQAKMLADMRDLDRRHVQYQASVTQRIFHAAWVLMAIISAAFLVNAALMYWALKRGARARNESAL
jgi:predicted PurR-regulated permease PerM